MFEHKEIMPTPLEESLLDHFTGKSLKDLSRTDTKIEIAYARHFIRKGLQYWAELGLEPNDRISAKQAIEVWLREFKTCENAEITPNAQQLKHYCQMTQLDEKKVGLIEFIHLLLSVGAGDKRTFIKGKEPLPGDVIDLIYAEVQKNPLLAKHLAEYTFLSRQNKILLAMKKYAENPADAVVFSLGIGRQGLNSQETYATFTTRLNLIATICPHEKSPDEHLELIGINDHGKLGFIHKSTDRFYKEEVPKAAKELIYAKSKNIIPMNKRFGCATPDNLTKPGLINRKNNLGNLFITSFPFLPPVAAEDKEENKGDAAPLSAQSIFTESKASAPKAEAGKDENLQKYLASLNLTKEETAEVEKGLSEMIQGIRERSKNQMERGSRR